MITGVILTHNEERNIVSCIEHLRPHVAELILIDTESTDRTVELARPLVDRVLNHPHVPNFDAARNIAIPEALHEWLWFVDADEQVPFLTGQLVNQLIRERGNEFEAITIPFKSYFCGQWIQHCGWWPGYTRPGVLKRGYFEFARKLHGGVKLDGREILFAADPRTGVDHYSYRDLDHWVEKNNRYTTTEALQMAERGVMYDWRLALRSMVHELWNCYELCSGDRDGERGWILSWCASQYRWFSIAKLIDLGRSSEQIGGHSSIPADLNDFVRAMEEELAYVRAEHPTLPLGIVWRAPIREASSAAAESREFVLALAGGRRSLCLEAFPPADVAEVPEHQQALFAALERCRRSQCVVTVTQWSSQIALPDPFACHNILRLPADLAVPLQLPPTIDGYDELWLGSSAQEQAVREAGGAPERLKVVPAITDQNSRTEVSGASAAERIDQLIQVVEKRLERRIIPPPRPSQIRVVLEGEFFSGHSFSNINEEIARRLIHDPAMAVSLQRTPSSTRLDRQILGSHQLRPYLGRPLEQGADITIRHAFPPNLKRPTQGKWVHIQPWEFGYLPKTWVDPMRDQVDEIWVMSRYVQQVYLDSGVPAERLQYIPWGIDPATFRPDVVARRLPTNKSFRFLFVGGTIMRKGFDRVLAAYLTEFTQDDDVCLVVKSAGSATFYSVESMHEQILAAQQVPTNPAIVLYEGEWTPGQLASLYAACHCFVAPYRGEGFGLPVLEALACGVPPIVPRGGPTDDFVDSDSGFVVPSLFVPFKADPPTCGLSTELHVDLTDLRASMRQAYRAREHTRQLGLVGSRRVREQFTWDRTASDMAERLHVLASRSGSTRTAVASPQSTSIKSRAVESLRLAALVDDAADPHLLAETLARLCPFVDTTLVKVAGTDHRVPLVAMEYGATLVGPMADESVANADWRLHLHAGEYLQEEDVEALRRWLDELPDNVSEVTFEPAAVEKQLGANAAAHEDVRLRRVCEPLVGNNLATVLSSRALTESNGNRRAAPFAMRSLANRKANLKVEIAAAARPSVEIQKPLETLPPDPSATAAHDVCVSAESAMPLSAITYGRLKRSLLIQMATCEHEFLLSLSRDHHRRYATRHSMDYWCVTGNPAVGKRPSWGKIPLLLAGIGLGYENVVWLDADAIIVRLDVNIGSLAPRGVGMVRHSNPEHWNAGFIVAHADSSVERFLRKVESAPENTAAWMEQVVVNELAMTEEFRELFHNLGVQFNSVPGVVAAPDPVIIAGHGLPFPRRHAILVEALTRLNDHAGQQLERITRREEFGELLNRHGLIGEAVEVGVYRGEYSECLLQNWHGRMLHLVDAWRHIDGCHDITNPTDVEHEANLEETRRRLLSYVGRFRIHRLLSADAVGKFEPRTIDFVYLDADHSFEAVWRDLHLWYPTVRPGGIFGGHDFLNGDLPEGSFGVASAVLAFAQEMGLNIQVTDPPWPSWYLKKPN